MSKFSYIYYKQSFSPPMYNSLILLEDSHKHKEFKTDYEESTKEKSVINEDLQVSIVRLKEGL